MSKVIVLSGCKDCPYVRTVSGHSVCAKYSIALGLSSKLPETPHPDCKLNDLPEIHDSIIDAGALDYSKRVTLSIGVKEDIITDFKAGANYILKEITK